MSFGRKASEWRVVTWMRTRGWALSIGISPSRKLPFNESVCIIIWFYLFWGNFPVVDCPDQHLYSDEHRNVAVRQLRRPFLREVPPRFYCRSVQSMEGLLALKCDYQIINIFLKVLCLFKEKSCNHDVTITMFSRSLYDATSLGDSFSRKLQIKLLVI